MKQVVCVALIFALTSAGCASSTVISSIPPGAKVYVDGQYLGRAPVTQKDTALLGSTKTVILKLKDHSPTVGAIRKEELKVGPLIGGIFLLIPLLWVTGYPSQYIFELESDTVEEPPVIPEVEIFPPNS